MSWDRRVPAIDPFGQPERDPPVPFDCEVPAGVPVPLSPDFPTLDDHGGPLDPFEPVLADPVVVAAQVRLMVAAWKSAPAGGLANDLRVCRDFCGLSLEQAMALREDIFDDWMLCTDGRIYHPFLAAQAQRHGRGPSGPASVVRLDDRRGPA